MGLLRNRNLAAVLTAEFVSLTGSAMTYVALPWFVLTITFMGQYALIMRNSLIGVMDDPFVMTARAKGVREKQILWRHVVPNALLPTLTFGCSRSGSSSGV